jgi:hypothetical protein
MKIITQEQAYQMFLAGKQIEVVKDKSVLVKQVQSDMQYTTVVAKEDGNLIVENAGTVSEGYLIRQIIYHNGVFYNNEYVIRNEEELNKRYVICEKQENVETGWVRYVPKTCAKKFVVCE